MTTVELAFVSASPATFMGLCPIDAQAIFILFLRPVINNIAMVCFGHAFPFIT
jgi:hypothetical protein